MRRARGICICAFQRGEVVMGRGKGCEVKEGEEGPGAVRKERVKSEGEEVGKKFEVP